VETLGLDFYGDTLTLFGGADPPRSYTVNLGRADAAVAASLAADATAAQTNAAWLARVPIVARDPNAVHTPIADIPPDPDPGHIMEAPTVFANYQLYIRFRLGFVSFVSAGTIQELPVVNTSEWHFFPTGRVLVRFKDHRAGLVYPITIVEMTDAWGAYRIESKPAERDILHLYADNAVFVETDLGEQIEMTLEEGRRSLFWGKEFYSLSAWIAEEKPIPCQLPDSANTSLLNTGVSLATEIAPDTIGGGGSMRLQLTGPVSGKFTMSGTAEMSGTFITERATKLAAPIVWTPVQTNTLPAGPFSLEIPQDGDGEGYFRVRQQ
jgi:hypothetical protein